MGGSDPHFPRILEANPHFPRIFKILTLLTFSKSSLSSIFKTLTFLFIPTKVVTQPVIMSNNEHFISQIARFLQSDLLI